MLGSFIATDIYRVLLGTRDHDTLAQLLDRYRLQAESALRQMRREDGTEVWVASVLIEGEALQRIALGQIASLVQVDNISARLRLPDESKPLFPSRGTD